MRRGICYQAHWRGSYRRIVSSFNDVVRLHVASLSKVIGVVGPHVEDDRFRLLEESPYKRGHAGDSLDLPKTDVLKLISDIGNLSRAAVEGRLEAHAGSSGPRSTTDDLNSPYRTAMPTMPDEPCARDVFGPLRSRYLGLSADAQIEGGNAWLREGALSRTSFT